MRFLKKFFLYIGIYLRANFKTLYFNYKYFPLSLAWRLPVKCSRNVYLRTMKGTVEIKGLTYSHMIKIGYGDIGIFDKKSSRTVWDVAGKVVFGGAAFIGQGSKISVNGELYLGENFSITAESTLYVEKMLNFGDNCLLSWDILIMDSDSHPVYDFENNHINPPKAITIGNHVWIGARCMILKGVSIESNNIIAAGTTIAKSISGENQAIGGNPARVLKRGITWKV